MAKKISTWQYSIYLLEMRLPITLLDLRRIFKFRGVIENEKKCSPGNPLHSGVPSQAIGSVGIMRKGRDRIMFRGGRN